MLLGAPFIYSKENIDDFDFQPGDPMRRSKRCAGFRSRRRRSARSTSPGSRGWRCSRGGCRGFSQAGGGGADPGDLGTRMLRRRQGGRDRGRHHGDRKAGWFARSRRGSGDGRADDSAEDADDGHARTGIRWEKRDRFAVLSDHAPLRWSAQLPSGVTARRGTPHSVTSSPPTQQARAVLELPEAA